MRLSTPLKTTLSAAAALALLTACGGGSDDDASASSSSSSSATSSSAAESSGGGDSEATAFCADAQDAFTELQSAATSAADPSTIPALFADASARLDAIEPPAEISEPWGVLTGALDTAIANIQGLDLNTPEGQQAFVAEFTQLQSTATDAQAQVESYVTANCDLPTESAAPTS